MQALTPFGSGSLRLGGELGKGGEGSVYTVTASELSELPPASELVAKIYHEPLAEERPKKLKAMISSPVHDPSVAWPLAVIVDDDKRFLGYLMKRLDSASYREWLYIANPKDRRKVAPAFDVRYAFAAVRNLAAALMAVHSIGHRVGDLNESNIFLGADATVLIVDTDSMQIQGGDGKVFPCSVGKPEFTAPELTHGSLRDTPRSVETDIFAFAVAAYQLLLGGSTPHQGAFDPSNEDDPLPQVERIRKGILPALAPAHAATFGFSPRPGVPMRAIPNFLKAHLEAFLSVEPQERNDRYRLSTLLEALDRFIPTLQSCAREPNHWFPAGEACGWCASAAESGQDPWGGVATVSPAQAKLDPISFHDHSPGPGNSRAAAAVAGNQAHSANRQAAGLPASSPPPPAATGGGPSAPFTPNPPAAGPAAAPTTPQRPHKVKGKVTVEYADGSWGVRPPLGVLMRTRPKIALWALKEETPDSLKFWWPVDRDLASPGGLWLGLGFSVISAVSWYFLSLTAILAIPQLQFMAAIGPMVALAPAFTALLAGTFLLFAGFGDRSKTRKRYGGLGNFRQETTAKTLLRFLPLGFFYGLPIVLVLIFLVIYLLIIFMRAVARA